MNSKPPPQVQYRRVLRFINLYLKPAPWLVRDHFLIAFCPLKRMFGGNLHGHICSSWPGWPCWPEVLLGGRFLETLAKTKTTQAVHQISSKRQPLRGTGILGSYPLPSFFVFVAFNRQFCWIYILQLASRKEGFRLGFLHLKMFQNPGNRLGLQTLKLSKIGEVSSGSLRCSMNLTWHSTWQQKLPGKQSRVFEQLVVKEVNLTSESTSMTSVEKTLTQRIHGTNGIFTFMKTIKVNH